MFAILTPQKLITILWNRGAGRLPLPCPICHFDKQALAVPDSACSQEITHRATAADHSSPRAGNHWEGGGAGGRHEGRRGSHLWRRRRLEELRGQEEEAVTARVKAVNKKRSVASGRPNIRPRRRSHQYPKRQQRLSLLTRPFPQQTVKTEASYRGNAYIFLRRASKNSSAATNAVNRDP